MTSSVAQGDSTVGHLDLLKWPRVPPPDSLPWEPLGAVYMPFVAPPLPCVAVPKEGMTGLALDWVDMPCVAPPLDGVTG